MKNSLLKCLVHTAFILASLFAVLGHSLDAEALKPNDIRNYLGTRTPYRFKYNKDDSKKKFPSMYKLFILFFIYYTLFSLGSR